MDVDCLVRTRVLEQEYSFKWIMENYSKLKNDMTIKSPTFLIEIDCEWWMEIYKTDRFLSIYLLRTEKHDTVDADCEISVADGNGKVWHKSIVCLIFNDVTETGNLLFNLRLKASDIREKAKDIVEITLLLKLHKKNTSQMDTLVRYNSSSEEKIQRDVQKSIWDDLQKLFESRQNTDVILNIEGETLEVHKSILIARSPVFANMFQHEIAESADNVVLIQDVKMAAMKEVVAFMYGSAKRDYDCTMAVDVYHAAKKYGLDLLSQICSGILASKLDTGNAYQILQLADRHEDQWLTKTVVKFIAFHNVQENDLQKSLLGRTLRRKRT